MRTRAGMAVSALAVLVGMSRTAEAQYPPQPYPPQPYPPQPYPPQPYPPQPAPPPPQAAPQPYPPQPYPPPGPPPQYPPQPLPAPYGPPPLVMQPPRPPPSRYRSFGEMAYLYGVSTMYGVGIGIWVDSLAKISDPGIAFIPPVLFGAAVPIGAFIWDNNSTLDRGVPSSIGTGLLLGGIEGIAISGLQWQFTGNGGPRTWQFSTDTTMTFLTATAGGVGGFFFGEWFQPDPRSLALIASGAAWGTLAGVMFGSGVVTADNDWTDGMAVWGFAGYNLGMVGAGAIATFYTPSWQSLKYMWAGDILGTLATTPVYLFYIGSSAPPRHGLIANSLGGLAGLSIAAALSANLTDPPGTASWTPPFEFSIAPTKGGAQAMAFGQF
jgi:hypothetical protein